MMSRFALASPTLLQSSSHCCSSLSHPAVHVHVVSSASTIVGGKRSVRRLGHGHSSSAYCLPVPTLVGSSDSLVPLLASIPKTTRASFVAAARATPLPASVHIPWESLTPLLPSSSSLPVAAPQPKGLPKMVRSARYLMSGSCAQSVVSTAAAACLAPAPTQLHCKRFYATPPSGRTGTHTATAKPKEEKPTEAASGGPLVLVLQAIFSALGAFVKTSLTILIYLTGGNLTLFALFGGLFLLCCALISPIFGLVPFYLLFRSVLGIFVSDEQQQQGTQETRKEKAAQ